jgi:archaellum component FlaC
MMENNGKGGGIKKSMGLKIGWAAFILIVVVIACSAISWTLVTRLATPKSIYAADITKINNTVGHMRDLENGLNSYASVQNSKINDLSDSTQVSLDSANNKISEVNVRADKIQADVATVSSHADNLGSQLTTQSTQFGNQISEVKQQISDARSATDSLTNNFNTLTANSATLSTNLNTLTATVNGITGGTQVTPSVSYSSTNGGTGSITLEIESGIAQTMAFRVEFRPTADLAQAATMDASLSALYAAPAVTLNETSTGGTAVRGDYNLYWSTTDSKYHLGTVIFMTQETYLYAGPNSKTLYFSYKAGTAPSFEILVTPVCAAASTSTGASPATW